MKQNPKAPWYLTPSKEQLEQGWDLPRVLYCPACFCVWDLPGALSCPSCENNLKAVPVALLSDDAENLHVKSFRCYMHGKLTAHQLKFIQVRKGQPHEGQRFGYHCTCKRTAYQTYKTLLETLNTP